MTYQARITTTFVIAQAELLLRVLERTLHSPTTKSRQQQMVQRFRRRSIAHKVFDLFRVQHISRNDKSKRLVQRARS